MTNTSQIKKTLQKLPKARLKYSVRARLYFQILLKELMPKPLFVIRLATLVVFLFFVFSGVSVYAYYTVSVTDGDMLFGLKTKIEHVKLVTADPGYEKSLAYLSIADRRLAEAEYLAKGSLGFAFIHTAYAASEDAGTPLGRTIRAVFVYTEKAIDEATTVIDAGELEELLATISKRQKRQLAVLTEMKITGVEENDLEIIDSVILTIEHSRGAVMAILERVSEERKKGIETAQFQIEKPQKKIDGIVPDSQAAPPVRQDTLPAPSVKNGAPTAPISDIDLELQPDDQPIPAGLLPKELDDIDDESAPPSEGNAPEDINLPLPEMPKAINMQVPQNP